MNDIDGGIAVAENLFTDENAEYSAVIFGKRVIEGNALNGKVAGDGGFALGLVFLGDGNCIAGSREKGFNDRIVRFDANLRRYDLHFKQV